MRTSSKRTLPTRAPTEYALSLSLVGVVCLGSLYFLGQPDIFQAVAACGALGGAAGTRLLWQYLSQCKAAVPVQVVLTSHRPVPDLSNNHLSDPLPQAGGVEDVQFQATLDTQLLALLRGRSLNVGTFTVTAGENELVIRIPLNPPQT